MSSPSAGRWGALSAAERNILQHATCQKADSLDSERRPETQGEACISDPSSLARQEGLEPPTGGLEIHCSVLLSYWREPSAECGVRLPADLSDEAHAKLDALAQAGSAE